MKEFKLEDWTQEEMVDGASDSASGIPSICFYCVDCEGTGHTRETINHDAECLVREAADLKVQRDAMRDALISVQAELERAWYRQEGPRAYSEHEAAILQTIAEALKIGGAR